MKPASINFASDDDAPQERVVAATVSRINRGGAGVPDPAETDVELEDTAEFSMDDLDDDEIVERPAKGSKAKGKKKGIPAWALVVIGLLFLSVVVGGGFIIVAKKRAAAASNDMSFSLPDQSPQPQIIDSGAGIAPASPEVGGQVASGSMQGAQPVAISPNAPIDAVQTPVSAAVPPASAAQTSSPAAVVTPAPVSATAVAPAPVSAPVAPAPALVASTPAPVVVTPAAVAANDAVAKDVANLRQVVMVMLQRLERIESDLKAKSVPVAVAVAPKPAQPKLVVVQKAKPAPPVKQAVSTPPVRKSFVEKTAPIEEVVEPTLLREYWISGIVNNRAFIVRKTSDGAESEQSVVVGDRIDGGKRVMAIDPREKVVIVEGGQRITTARNR